MAADIFLAQQAEFQNAPNPSWERWTIDELDADIARLLVARASDTSFVQETSEALLAAGAAQLTGGHRLTSVLRRQIMTAELQVSELWRDERDGFAPADQLERFLRRRGGKPGLPTNRPLREGDTFWIIAAAGIPELHLDLVGEPADMLAHLAAVEQAGAQVWDVTAGARQAAKATYQSAIQTAGEQRELVNG